MYIQHSTNFKKIQIYIDIKYYEKRNDFFKKIIFKLQI